MCDNFKPQAWRKKVCQNCFHPKDEHTIVEESSQKDNDGKFAPPPRTFSFKNLHARDQGESSVRFGGTGEAAAAIAAAAEDGQGEIAEQAEQEGNDDEGDRQAHPPAAAAHPNGAARHADEQEQVLEQGHHAWGDNGVISGGAPPPPPPPPPVVASQHQEPVDSLAANLHQEPVNSLAADLQRHHVEPVVSDESGDEEEEDWQDEGGAAAAAAGHDSPPRQLVPPPPVGAPEIGATRAGMLSAIVGGVPLRSVPKEVLEERRRQKEKPTDVASEMATRLQGKKEIAIGRAKAVLDAEQGQIETVVSDLNFLLTPLPVRLRHLMELCERADKLKNLLMSKMETSNDSLLVQRVSWPIPVHLSLRNVVAVLKLLMAEVDSLKEMTEETKVAGVDSQGLPVMNVDTVTSCMTRLLKAIGLLRRDNLQADIEVIHASHHDIDELLSHAQAPCVYLLDVLFKRALHAARALSGIGLSRYALTYRVNHTSALLRSACRLNDELSRALLVPRHDDYSDTQLSLTTLSDKYQDIQAVHQKSGEWDKEETVVLKSSTSVRPPVKTRLSAREAVSRDAVLCIQEGRREDFKQLLVSCSQQLQHFGAVHAAIILQTLALGDCEVLTWVVEELKSGEGLITPARQYEWLHEAITKGLIDVVTHLVQECKFDINCRNLDQGNTPLHVAVRSVDFASVAKLVRLGADVLMINSAMHTPLQILALKCFPPKQTNKPRDPGHDTYASYVNNPNLSDVVLVCDGEDGRSPEKCYAHRILLCGQSTVFRTMLDTAIWVEGSQREVHLPDIRYAVLLAVIEYIYTGACFFPTDDLNLAVELLEAANRFLLPGLARIVESVLCCKITPEVAIPIYQASYLYSSPMSSALLGDVLNFVLFNYAQLSDPDHELLLHILENQKPMA